MSSIVGTPAYLHVGSFVENSHTLSVTVPVGAAALLLGATINRDNWGQLTSLTVDGVDIIANVAGSTPSGVANRSARWWYLLNPTAGTYNVVWNYTTSSENGGGMVAICVDTIDGATPINDAQQSSTGSGSSPLSNSITTPTGGIAFVAAHADTAQPSPIGGQTTLGTNEQNHSFSYKADAAAMGVTFTGSPQIAQSVISIKPGAPPPPPPPPPPASYALSEDLIF